MLEPSLDLSFGYDDNVYSTRNDRDGDFISILTPSLTAEAEGQDFDLELNAGAEIGRYRKYDSENYEDYYLGADGRYRFSPAHNLIGGVTFRRAHEGRDSPDDVNGEEPTIYHDLQAYLGTVNRFGRFTTRVAGTYQFLNFDDVRRADFGAINNDDRDRHLYTAGARVGYQLSPNYEVFAQGSYDRRRYRDTPDDWGLNRDSQGFRSGLGLRYVQGQTLELEAMAGYMLQDYEDADLETIKTWDARLNASWRFASNTRLEASFDRTIEETTLSASGYVSSGFGLGLVHLLRPDLSTNAGLGYYKDDYYGDPREDNVFVATLGGRYYFQPNFYLGADYRFLRRDSSDPDDDYDDNRFLVSFGVQLAPEYEEDQLDLPGVPSGKGGFYGGLQTAIGKIGTELEGERGQPSGSGSLTSDFGDHGFSGGAFAGYGSVIGPAYLALEADIEQSRADWIHTREPNHRVFGVEKNLSGSLGPLVGYLLPGGMIYGRVAGVLADMETTYREGDNDYSEDNTVAGVRFGVGMEVPVSGGLFTRMDFSHTNYEDYDITSNNGRVDNFANNESLLRLGIGYRFGAQTRDEDREDFKADFDGFYGGVQLGFGSLQNDLQGPRREGGNPGDLDAQYADESLAGGFFAGYGQTFGPVYLGGEGEIELADGNIDLERQPSGRKVQLSKEATYGAGLRVGYLLNDAAMLYGRIGGVLTDFGTDYEVSSNKTSQDNLQRGLRFGGGLEVAASENIFLRLDYTYTKYDSFKVSYGESGGDSFEPSESLIRLGIGYRF